VRGRTTSETKQAADEADEGASLSKAGRRLLDFLAELVVDAAVKDRDADRVPEAE
jgi:hypothetical protein